MKLLKAVCIVMIGFALITPIPSTFAKQKFKDVFPNDYYFTAVDHFTTRKIVNGYQDGTFQPHKKMTRAEAAVIFSESIAD